MLPSAGGGGTELLVLETAEMCVKVRNVPQINFVVEILELRR